MRKSLYTLAITAFSALFLTACFDESGLEKIYDGPAQIEFDWGDQAQVETYVYNPPTRVVATDSIRINIIGPQQSQPVNVQWQFDAEESTAVEGVQFRFATTSRTATIPANSSYGYIPIEILMDNFEVGEEYSIVANITSADLPIAPGLDETTFFFSKVCPSEIPAGIWSTNVADPDGGFYEIEIESVGGGEYIIKNFNLDFQPPFYDTFDNLPISGRFADVCNELTLIGTSQYSVTWRGTGVYDQEAQTITFDQVRDPAYGQGPWSNAGQGYVFTFVE